MENENENLSEAYYKVLDTVKSPHVYLLHFYCDVYDLDFDAMARMIPFFGKLVKLYGRHTLFYSILDMIGASATEPTEPYGYLSTVCQSRFKKATDGSNVITDLSPMLKKFEDLRANMGLVKIKKEPFDE
jgi:hypothetical protein